MKKLGFGTMRLPLTESRKQMDIDYEQVNRMADCFLNNGFTYVDTAYIYHDGMSEAAVKRAFVERYPRNSFVLADKMPVKLVKSSKDYPRIFVEQQKRCGVDFFDYYLIHDITRQCIENVEKTGGFDFLRMLKDEGKAKYIGFSYHDTAELLDKILRRHPEVEFVQLQINYADWDNDAIQSRKCYDVCVRYGKPVIVMEPVKGGALANVPAEISKLFLEYNPDTSVASWAVRYAASLGNVIVVLSGMSNIKQMKDNVSYMKEFIPLCADEEEIIKHAVEGVNKMIAIPCTGCRYCINHEPGCPMNIAIPEYFALYNNMIQFGVSWSLIQGLRSLSLEHGVTSDCIECGQCEEQCPQHIKITKWLKEIQEWSQKVDCK